MKVDIVFAGVGGQGVVTIARLLAAAALEAGLFVVQGELHGMSQRGGAVQAQLRLADGPIESPQIAQGGADLLVGLEPVEALRCVPWLAPEGRLCCAMRSVENVPEYPPLEEVLEALRGLHGTLLVDAHGLALAAGSARAENFAMAGAAAALLPIPPASARGVIERYAQRWSERDRQAALAAFDAGAAEAHEESGLALKRS